MYHSCKRRDEPSLELYDEVFSFLGPNGLKYEHVTPGAVDALVDDVAKQ